MHQLKKSFGGALLTALFIMTLVAIVATAMSTRLQLDIYRTRLTITHDKLYLASQAVLFWAMNELNGNTRKFTKLDKQGMVAQYPGKMERLVDQIQLNGGLYDLQARFNLNNLIEKKLLPVFIDLIGHTTHQLNSKEQLNLALGVQNWLTAYDLARGKDNYSTYYLSQKPPYYPSHQLMSSATEFRLIKDVSSELYQAIGPFITALPETIPININTASKKVLMSLGNGITEAQVNELIMARGENGITDLKDITELAKKINLPNEQITIESKYFLSVAFVTSDEFQLTVYTLLKRSKDKQGKISVGVIRESINTF
ncbi:type II secretion system protein K [Legionella antarctica]|uniref:Type II secretion system protein K n=1 Tax=Legionella antarctica TaxID=2708020 RepID=A0A6F8T4C6_9GAMM|nr:type II secretion system minor pseudopilin GspK [Legionella antarctica]BCA95299.1 type II secretion system protein K [Legionella antarctica]